MKRVEVVGEQRRCVRGTTTKDPTIQANELVPLTSCAPRFFRWALGDFKLVVLADNAYVQRRQRICSVFLHSVHVSGSGRFWVSRNRVRLLFSAPLSFARC